MGEEPIRYEAILRRIRRNIITGKYPVGSTIPSVKNICDEYKIGSVTAYKIFNILEKEGLIQYVSKKGGIVIPFDQEEWMEKIHEEANALLKDALDVCKEVALPTEQVVNTISAAYTKQPRPSREQL